MMNAIESLSLGFTTDALPQVDFFTLQSITDDHSILKQILKSGDSSKTLPKWNDNDRAEIIFKIWTVPTSHSTAEQQSHHHSHSDHHHHDHGHHHKDNSDNNKLYQYVSGRRQLICRSEDYETPTFHLIMGRNFKVTCLEDAIKTMRIGEKVRFYVMPKHHPVRQRKRRPTKLVFKF